MVVIPAASVENSDENNIVAWAPMQAYNTSFEIPNGTIDKFIKEWSSQGIEGLDIQFYDKGYSQLKNGFERMRSISMILLIVGMAIILLVLIFFTFYSSLKTKKERLLNAHLGLGVENAPYHF